MLNRFNRLNRLRCSAIIPDSLIAIMVSIEHGFTSAPTQYRLYGRRDCNCNRGHWKIEEYVLICLKYSRCFVAYLWWIFRFFELDKASRTRGHILKLKKSRVVTDLRHFFTERVITFGIIWNNLLSKLKL